MDKLQPATYTITERGAHRAKKKKRKKEYINKDFYQATLQYRKELQKEVK